MSRFLPAEHYNWFWNNLKELDPNNRIDLNKFRERYRAFEDRLKSGPRFYKRLGQLRNSLSNAFNEAGIELSELPANESELSNINRNLIEDPEEIVHFDLQEPTELQPLEYESVTDYGSAGGEFASTLSAAEEGLGAAGAAAAPSTAAYGAAAGTLGIIGGSVAVIGATRGFTLPGHNYIGPGNDADREEEPVDTDDQIAQVHDKQYQSAKNQEDIYKADEEAIEAFDKDWQESGNLHSLVGKAGLQIKNTVEKHTGILYPPNLPSISGKSLLLWDANMLRIRILLRIKIFHLNHLANIN